MVSVLAKETNNFAESTKFNICWWEEITKRKKEEEEKKKTGAKRKVYDGLLRTIQEGC